MGQDLADFPHFQAWLEELLERPRSKKGVAWPPKPRNNLADDKEAQKILFGQRAR